MIDKTELKEVGVLLLDNGERILIKIQTSDTKQEYLTHEAIVVLSKRNAEKLASNFLIPYMPEFITGQPKHLKGAFAHEMKITFERLGQYKCEITKNVIAIVMTEYYREYFATNEWYRLARENEIINPFFSDGYCNETTFFADGVSEIVGSLSVCEKIKTKLKSELDLNTPTSGNEFDIWLCLLISTYAYHVADSLLISDRDLALNYICLAHSAEVYGSITSMIVFKDEDFKLDKSNRARELAQIRHKKDPKQMIKNEAEKIYKDWKTGKFTFTGKADFARFIQSRHKDENDEPIIKDLKTITDNWCREFEEKNTTPAYDA